MEIPFGNVLPSKSSAYSFLVLLIRFYEGVRLTHQTSESGPSATSGDVRYSAAMGGIVLQNSKNGLQRFFREKSNQATIADRCVLERATEVAGEFITSCCGPPARLFDRRAHSPEKFVFSDPKRVSQHYRRTSGHQACPTPAPRFMMGWTPPDGIDVPKWRC